MKTDETLTFEASGRIPLRFAPPARRAFAGALAALTLAFAACKNPSGPGLEPPSAPAPPPAPTLIAGTNSITVTWEAVSGASSYEVYYGTSKNIGAAIKLAVPSGTSTTISGLSLGLYHVWIAAKGPGGTSAYSAPGSVKLWDRGLLNNLKGYWDSFADVVMISEGALTYDDCGTTAMYDWPSTSYTGEIVDISAIDADSGVIVVRYAEKPDSPYTSGKGTSDYHGIYYKKSTEDWSAVKFGQALYTGAANIVSLEAAVEQFSPANSAAMVTTNWDAIYTYFKSAAELLDMGALRGTWTGDDDLYPTYLRITDFRLTVYMAGVGYEFQAYSGIIAGRTDPSAQSGYIYLRLAPGEELGLLEMMLEAEEDDYYGIYWRKEGEKTRFSVYNDNPDVLSSDLGALKALTYGDGAFDETEDTETGGLAVSGYVYVGFTK
jgi:hypothetical protein